METTSTLMGEFILADSWGLIPALCGDPLVCRDADLEIPKLRQTESRVDPGSVAGMTSVMSLASGGYQ